MGEVSVDNAGAVETACVRGQVEDYLKLGWLTILLDSHLNVLNDVCSHRCVLANESSSSIFG